MSAIRKQKIEVDKRTILAKRFFQILLAISVMFVSTIASAQQEEGKKVIGEMVDACATVMGANHLEQRCSKLDKKLGGQLSDNATECKKKMVTVIGLPAKMLQDMDSAAKATADKQECNDGAEKIAAGALDFGKRLKNAFVGFEKQLKPGQTVIVNKK